MEPEEEEEKKQVDHDLQKASLKDLELRFSVLLETIISLEPKA